MIQPLPFDPARFAGAAPHYLQGRPAYAPELFGAIAVLCGLDGTGRLLDLGCGPGQIALAMRRHVAEAVGMDPEPGMLEQARAAAAGTDVQFVHGSSTDLGPALGRLRMVTIGRAFHWMDRAATARSVADLLEPRGALVLLSTRALPTPDTGWQAEYEALLLAARGGRRPAWQQPGWVTGQIVLLESPLSRVGSVSMVQRGMVQAEDLVHRALSMSATTRAKLGPAGAEALADKVRALVPAGGCRRSSSRWPSSRGGRAGVDPAARHAHFPPSKQISFREPRWPSPTPCRSASCPPRTPGIST